MTFRWPTTEAGEPARPSPRAVGLFGLVALIGFIAALLPPYSGRPGVPLLAGFILMLSVLTAFLACRRATRTWLDPVAPLLFFVCVALLRDASGGSTSGLAPLVVLPILWLALFGTRTDLVLGVVMTAGVFAVPLLLIGPPDYPLSDWRRGILWCSIALFIAPVIQRVVWLLAVQTRRERELSAQVHALMRGATLTSLISTDVAGTVTSFSVGAEALLGYSAEEMVGRHTPGTFHDPDEVAEAARELGVEPGFAVFAELAGRRDDSRIWTYVRKDGTRIFVRLAVTELRDQDFGLVGYLGVAIDSTRAVEAERELALAEDRWRVVMDHLPDTTVLVVDAALHIHTATGKGAMRTLMGEVVGRTLRDVAKPENVELLEPLIGQALKGVEGRVDLTATLTGSEHDVVVSALPASADVGHEAQVLIMARDVSVDRAREREIARARDRAERLIGEAPQGIAVLDLEGTVLAANPALTAMLRRSADEVVGRALAALGSPGDDTIRRHLADLRSGASGRSQGEWTVSNADGQELHVSLSSTVLTGEGCDGDQILVNVVDNSERRRYEQQLAHLADHDPLTGLANRRRFATDLGRHLEFCRRYGPRGAVMLLDLDHFKEVNDTFGHSAGDQLIVSAANLVLQSVRSTDVVARLGGDEFAVLLQETDRAGAERVAESIVTRIRDHVSSLDGTRRNVTASLGVVMVDQHNPSVDDLLAAADLTMYDAKEAGRDRWAILDYALHDQPRTGARLAWHSRIEDAIANGQLELHLQPIVDVARGEVTGAEALLRLADGPELIYPDRFLYVAERTGLINKLDGWVLRSSIALLGELQRIRPGFHLEVNLSAKSIGHPDLESTLVEALDRLDVDPTGLVLEITETAAVADVATARAFAERVTALGCRFALDDFGAGFGSFYYLKHLLFDYVKIDGEFVANCHVDPTDRAIVNSIVGIAHGLGKRVVAEFVSESEIFDVIREEGVDFAQGYHLGRPVPAAEFVSTFLTGADREPDPAVRTRS